jgi:hypothetical protein
MFDQHVSCPECQIEPRHPAMPVESALPAPLTATLIAIPLGLWAALVVAGGMLFGAPVFAALALQLLALGLLLNTAARRRPSRRRRDRPPQVTRVERAALRVGPG